MNNKIKYSCDNCFFYSNTGCKSNILCIRGSNYFHSDALNISYQQVKIKKIEKSDEIKRLITARNILHRLENRGILENNLSTEQITAIRTAEYALDELCKSKDAQLVKRGKWIWKERHRNSYRIVNGTDRYFKEGDLQIHEEYKEKVNYCSVCGKQGHEVFLNFCPNCGARMDGDTK